MEMGINEKYKCHFKVCICGDENVGKKTSLNRLKTGIFEEDFYIDFDFVLANILVHAEDGHNQMVYVNVYESVKDNIFLDCPGGPYRNAHAVILMYDVSDTESLRNVMNWYSDATHSLNSPVFYLVGNKIDSEAHKIDKKVVMEIAERIGLPKENVMEISAKTGKGFDELWQKIGHDLFRRFIFKDLRDIAEKIDITTSTPKCCLV